MGIVYVTNVTPTVRPLLNVTNTPGVGTTPVRTMEPLWRAAGFNDSTWSNGFGLFGRETTPTEYPYPFQTTIPAPSQTGGHITVYYRTHFTWAGASPISSSPPRTISTMAPSFT